MKRADWFIYTGGWILLGLIGTIIVQARSDSSLPPLPPPIPLQRDMAPSPSSQWADLPYYNRQQLAREAAIRAIWGHPPVPYNEEGEALERFVLSGAGLH